MLKILKEIHAHPLNTKVASDYYVPGTVADPGVHNSGIYLYGICSNQAIIVQYETSQDRGCPKYFWKGEGEQLSQT